MHAASRTTFANLSPLAARSVLVATLLAIIFCVAVSLSPLASGYADAPSRGPSDVDLYHAEIGRMASGEPYYSAASAELHARGYPTQSVFNWRTPLPMWFIGLLPSAVLGRILIGTLAVVLLFLSLHVMARESNFRGALLGGLLLVGALLPCWLDHVYVMPEVWAGVLIALSICAFAVARPAFGVGLGLAALFLRELAAPYCAICFALALINRRWREAIAWLLGFFSYIAFYAWHISEVLPHIGPHDHAHVGSWLQFGGAAFVISLAQMNAFLLLLPQWVSAIYLPLALLGFAAWRPNSSSSFLDNSPATRSGLTACAYMIVFAFIGHPFNQYWGSLIAPLFCFGIAQCPAALKDLVIRCQFSARREPLPAIRGQ